MKSTDADSQKVDFAEISSESDSGSDRQPMTPSNRFSVRNTRRVRWTKKELKTLRKMVEKHKKNRNKMSEEDWENAAKALNQKFPETAHRTAINVQRQWNIYGKRKKTAANLNRKKQSEGYDQSADEDSSNDGMIVIVDRNTVHFVNEQWDPQKHNQR